MARPKKYHIILTEEERTRLKKLAKSSESKKLIRKRINILLDLDESQDKYLTYEQCVKTNATSMMNVYKVIVAYVNGGIEDGTVRWLDLNVSQIQDKFKDRNISVSEYVIRQMLKQRDFRRRSCKKAKTLKDVEDRDAQFKKIESITHECEILDIPILSMDTKKKEIIGNFKRDGRVYCQSAPKTYDHDFNTFANGMIAPHALYDTRVNVEYMTISTSHDTSVFVCDNIERI